GSAGPGCSRDAAALPRPQYRSGTDSPSIRDRFDRRARDAAMRPAAWAQGPRVEDAMGPAGADAPAGNRGLARRRISAARRGERGQDPRPDAGFAAAVADDTGRARGGVGWPPRPDDPA